MTTYQHIEEIFTKDEIDLYDYMIISLNDGYADYCYSKSNVRFLITKLRRYMSSSILIIKIGVDTDDAYFHILPIKIYKMFGSKPRLIKGMSIGSDNIPNSYKIVFEGSKEFPFNLTLKDFNQPIDEAALNDIVKITDKQNL